MPERSVTLKHNYMSFSRTLILEKPDDTQETPKIDNDMLIQILADAESQGHHVERVAVNDLEITSPITIAEMGRISKFIFKDCKIAGIDYSFSGAELMQFDRCQIGFFLSMSVRSKGHVNFFGCTFDSSVRPPQYSRPDQQNSTAIDMRNAQIDGHLVIRDSKIENNDSSFPSYGTCKISECTFGGSVFFHQISGFYDLNIRKCHIKKSLEVDKSSDAEVVRIADSKIELGAELRNCNLSKWIWCRNVEVGADFEIDKCSMIEGKTAALSLVNVAASGSILLKHLTIQGRSFIHTVNSGINFTISNCHQPSGQREKDGFQVLASRIGSFLLIEDSNFFSGLSIETSEIGASLNILRSRFSCNLVNTTSIEDKTCLRIYSNVVHSDIRMDNCAINGNCTTANTKVASDVNISNIEFQLKNGQIISRSRTDRVLYRFRSILFGPTYASRRARTFDWPTNIFDFSRTRATTIKIQSISFGSNMSLYLNFDDCYASRLYSPVSSSSLHTNVLLSLEGASISAFGSGLGEESLRTVVSNLRSNGRSNIIFPSSSLPYSQIASIALSAGDRTMADFAMIESRRAGGRTVSNPVIRFFNLMFDLFFGFGLSRLKASITLFMWLALGVAGVERAIKEDVFSEPTFHVTSAVRSARDGTSQSASPQISRRSSSVESIACADGIISTLYVIDMLVPFFDLEQVRNCSLKSSSEPDEDTNRKMKYWWWAKYTYTIAGWMIVTLFLATLSGLLSPRRE